MKRIEVIDVSKCYRIKSGAMNHAPTFRAAVTSSIRNLCLGIRPEEKEFWALRSVSFAVEAGEILGISGPNGSGKSTLLKLIAQITYPTQGRIIRRGRLASLIEVGAGFHPELSGRENVYLSAAIMGFKPQEVRPLFEEIVAFAGVGDHLDSPVKQFSSGMFVRLAVALALLLPVDILLLDETFAVADREFRLKCRQQLPEKARQGASVLVVSHNFEMLEGVVERVLPLDSCRRITG